jgi:hypothetical protein
MIYALPDTFFKTIPSHENQISASLGLSSQFLAVIKLAASLASRKTSVWRQTSRELPHVTRAGQ